MQSAACVVITALAHGTCSQIEELLHLTPIASVVRHFCVAKGLNPWLDAIAAKAKNRIVQFGHCRLRLIYKMAAQFLRPGISKLVAECDGLCMAGEAMSGT